jgi:fatty acid desaturase
MHFYAEHYATTREEALKYDTWSYYGFWNIFIYNVGYHREHHDNCAVAGIYLPRFKELWGKKYNTHGEEVHEGYVALLFNLLFMRWNLYRRCHREFQGSNDFTMVPDYLFKKEKAQ